MVAERMVVSVTNPFAAHFSSEAGNLSKRMGAGEETAFRLLPVRQEDVLWSPWH